MKKKFFQIIEIPENIEVSIDKEKFSVKGEKGENKRTFNLHNLELKKEDGKIKLGCEKATKREKKRINTIKAHIKNMVKGIREGFEYRLKICSSHFPITVKVENNEIIVKNFLGEKIERKSKIPKGVEIEINKDEIIVKSIDKELAGQMSANLERITKISKKDRRIFQDGIFITDKAGRGI